MKQETALGQPAIGFGICFRPKLSTRSLRESSRKLLPVQQNSWLRRVPRTRLDKRLSRLELFTPVRQAHRRQPALTLLAQTVREPGHINRRGAKRPQPN